MDDLIEKYRLELEADTKINELNVKEVQMCLPSIKHKWVARLIKHRQEISKLRTLAKKAREKIIEEHRSTSAITISNPVLEKTADNHKVIQEIYKQIEDHELMVIYLEKVEKILSAMSYDISNLVSLIKLETL